MFSRIFVLGVATVVSVLLVAPPSSAAQKSGSTAGGRVVGDPGADMYLAYCASCHGRKGIGDGPAAASLKKKPADLTRLAERNGGTFPSERIGMVLHFGVVVPPHGSSDMPTWGSIFRTVGDEKEVQQRVAALAHFLETLQVKK